MIRIPWAPFALSFSIRFQKSDSSITEWIELHPGSASGRMVGLFIPGNKLQMMSSLLFGAFSNTYLLFFAFFTARIRNKRLSKMIFFSFDSDLLATSTDSDERMVSISFNSFVKSVLPELTRSQMASASPIRGAISTEPLISWIAALMFFFGQEFSQYKRVACCNLLSFEITDVLHFPMFWYRD